MRIAIAIAFGIALVASTAYSQPKRAPKNQPKKPPAGAPAPAKGQAPAPEAPPPAEPAKPLGPDQEKANPDEKLHKEHVDDPAQPEKPKIPEVSPERREAATTAFREGNSYLNDGIFPKAVERYAEALKSWDHPAIHYNMALALMYLDRPIEQYESLQKAIKYGEGPLEKDKFDHAREYMVLVEKQLATVEVSCQKEGAKVTIDGKEVFTVEKGKPNTYKGRVRIGKHTFVAEKPGYATPVDAPFIGPGEVFRIELKLYTAEELTRYKRRWNRTWAPWAVIGGGAVAGLVGGLMQWSAGGSYKEFDDKVARCTVDAMNGTCDASGFESLKQSGDTKRTLGIVGYSLAGAAIVTGGLLVYLNRRTSYQITTDEYRMEELRKQKQQQKAISIAPIVGPDGGGAVVFGRF